ncbi:hypothetical protein B5E58_01375 [Tyzzerella sp. An114]|uniref:sigma-E processing peptidase SpoIIGA n=1 Tax=Tyzzerella sp. An114 TaxID=1965545 RepID=UPI000B453821|nr:sigma-E processing peptidase SpoIIGA [Tyzzerella sp. An114]OUQ60549.1 hypothetical protein B5E58_01375 [Tyzzerella sp. An114]
MEFEIYADIFFIINFFMNFSVLWVSAFIIKNRIKISKIFGGAFIITILYMVMLFNSFFHRFYGIFAGQIILILGVIFVFKPSTLYKTFIHTVRTDIISAFFCGIIIMLSNIFQGFDESILSIYRGFSSKIMILSAIFVYLLIFVFRKYILKTLNCEKFCNAEIFFNNKSIKLTALIDTGNELKDPLSGKSAIIAQTIDIVKLFDTDTAISILENARAEPEIIIGSIKNSDLLKKIRLLPFKSIDNDRGLMIGFLADKIKITLSDGRQREIENITVGMYGGELSPKRIYKAVLDYESCNF